MNKLSAFLIGVAMIMAMPLISSAQNAYEVKGLVLDEAGPMVGVTVLEKGTQNGTSTGTEGDFLLKVSSPAALVEISSIGYETIVFAANQLPAKVILKPDSEMLEETVVVGYGSLSKKEISSSVVSVNADNFNKAAAGDPMQLLVGKVAGLNIDVSADGSSSSFQIRGATSINGSNSPLIVIDGVAGASLSDVSTQDIESISVLKDGASAAIYGTRGANGVVLVTTRKGAGEAGRVRVTYDSYVSLQALHSMPEAYGLEEWLVMNKETGRDKTDYGSREENAYWKALRNDKPTYDINQHITLAGSTGKSNYNLSLNYTNRNRLWKNQKSETYRARFVMNQKFLGERLELSTNANVRANLNNGNNGNLTGTIFMNPTRPVYDETTPTGYFWPTHSTGATNSVENNQLPTNKNHRISVNLQEDIKVHIFRNDRHMLTTNAMISAGYRSYNEYSYTPSVMQTCQMWNAYAGSASINANHSLNLNFEWLVNYSLSIRKHNLKAVAGYSYTQYDEEYHNMSNSDFQYDQFLWYDMGSGTYLKSGLASMESGKVFNKLAGLFGRVTYSWNGLLTATASLRYEGSSKFGYNRKYGYFPAVSAAWTISNMGFMDGTKSWLDDLRIRASYGVTGRNAGDDYASLATYSSKGSNYYMDGEWVGGYGITRNANPNLGWETAVVYDYGIDFELFDSRLSGTIEYFDRRSENLLYTYTAPQPPYVYDRITLNLGSTQNRGVEIALNWSDKIGKNWNYSVGGTYSYTDAFLRSIGNDVYAASYIDLGSLGTVGSSEYRFRLEEGSRIGDIRGYEYAGYNDEGQLLHYTADGGTASKTGVVDDDKKIIGNTLPKHSFSVYFTLRYKQWNLTINGRGLAGMDIWNSQLQSYGLPGVTSDNLLKSAYEKYPHLTADNDYLNSFYLEKGDWFKLEKISVGRDFKFKKNKAGFESMNIYLAATNIFTITGFTGVDPSTVSSVGLTPGISSSANLYTSAITLGLSARF